MIANHSPKVNKQLQKNIQFSFFTIFWWAQNDQSWYPITSPTWSNNFKTKKRILFDHMSSYHITLYDIISYDIISYDIISHHKIWYEIIRYDKIWYVMIRHDMLWWHMVWFFQLFFWNCLAMLGIWLGIMTGHFEAIKKMKKKQKMFFLKLSIDLWAMICYHHWVFLAPK